MLLQEFVKLLNDILTHRSEDVPKYVNTLESLSKELHHAENVKEFNDTGQDFVFSFSKLAFETYCHALTSAKLARALDKALRLLPSPYITCFDEELERVLQHVLTQNKLGEIRLLSSLLEQNPLAKMKAKKHFVAITKILRNLLCSYINGEITHHGEMPEQSHYICKLSIQVIQLFPQDIQQLFTARVPLQKKEVKDGGGIESLCRQWEEIVLKLIQLLLQSTNRDLLLLTGTSLAMALNLTQSLDSIQNVYKGLIAVLLKEKISIKIKELEMSFDSSIRTDASLHVVAVIKGLLVSCDKEALCSGNFPLLLEVFPRILHLCQGPAEHHYLAFQIFALWYQKLTQMSTTKWAAMKSQYISLWSLKTHDFCSSPLNGGSFILLDGNCSSIVNEGGLMSKNCSVLHSTLSCIWLNWDSPVEGVSELVIEVFSHLLSLWHQTVKDGRSDNKDMCQLLVNCLLTVGWQSRSRYRPLSLLIPYVDGTKLIQVHPQLQKDLLDCMKTNHMAATATDVYRAFLQQILSVDKENATHLWKELWMPTLLSGLASSDSLQRQKMCTYWLPLTLELIANSHAVLLDALEPCSAYSQHKHKNSLFGWVTVYRAVRALIQVPWPPPQSSVELIREALWCTDEATRSEAYLMLCSTMKKSEPISELEASLLQEYIPVNLKTDSAVFRQCLTSGFRKLLVRIRDSCWSAIKRNKMDEDFLDRGVNFVDQLHQVLMLSLAPGSCYQRRQTGFDLLAALLETLVFDKQDTSKKGKAPESSDTLLHFAQTRSMWNFFSDDNLLVILICLQDGSEEIQAQCCSLLMKYFHWPTEKSSEGLTILKAFEEIKADVFASSLATESAMLHILNHGFTLTSNPRAYENNSGLLIISLILRKYVLDKNMIFCLTEPEISEIKDPPETKQIKICSSGALEPGQAATAFMDLLVGKVKTSLNAVMNNFAAEFKVHSIHGLTKCLTQSLVKISNFCRQEIRTYPDTWINLLEEIVDVNQTIISLALDVLAGGKAIEHCLSLADVGVALMKLISDGIEQEEEMTSLTPDFQFLLSWCWINLKESCSCLGEVTGIVVSNSEQQKFPVQLLCNIGQTLVKVLTTCRHRGAIEGCRSGFYLFCSSLLSNSEKELSDIPRAILRKILASLLENSMSSSVTRRSAGLPIIIQTVVQAARKCGDTSLLLTTVDYLYTIASKQLPDDCSQQHDLSQSHALNILKVIFCDASLAPVLMPLLSKMTILVVEGFESPSWAIRNAATQLISTLVTRIFGQRNQLESGSSMTLEEFSSLYPELIQFVFDKLQSHSESNIAVRPSLYVILTLMSGIGMSPSYQHTSSLREPLQQAVVSFLSNPVYSLRRLSARAHTSLIPSDRAEESFRQILLKIQERGAPKNELHGWLICALNLLSSGCLSSEMNFTVVTFVVDNCWLLEARPCLLVPSTVVELTLLAVKQTPIDLHLLGKLWSAVKTLFSAVSSSMEKYHVGSDHCMDVCMKMMTAIYQSSEEARRIYHSQLSQLYSECLVSPLDGLRATLLDLVKEEGDSFRKDEEIQKNVWMIISHDDNRTNVTKAVDVMLSATLNGDLHFHVITLTVKKLSHCQRDTSSNFVVESIKFHFADDVRFIEWACDLEEWCAQLVSFASPSHNEDLRLLAAQCVSVAGGNILQFCCRHKNLPGVEQAVTCLIKASLQLLEDTETEVRRTVSRFVTHLSCQASLHYTTSYYILSEFIVHNLSWCEATISTLLNMVYVPGKLCQAISSVQNSRLQQLFEPETNSPYSEVHMTQLWAYKTIESLVQSEFLVKQLNVMMSATLMELISQMTVIQENVLSQPIFNMTCESKVMSAILGIHLISQLYNNSCKNHSSPISADGETLQELVIQLQQFPSLHPFLRRNQFDYAQVRPSVLEQCQYFEVNEKLI